MADRILIGNRATGGYGLYVSKPGEPVLTCGVDDLIFSTVSSFNLEIAFLIAKNTLDFTVVFVTNFPSVCMIND